jgi:hypothetical protein
MERGVEFGVTFGVVVGVEVGLVLGTEGRASGGRFQLRCLD